MPTTLEDDIKDTVTETLDDARGMIDKAISDFPENITTPVENVGTGIWDAVSSPFKALYAAFESGTLLSSMWATLWVSAVAAGAMFGLARLLFWAGKPLFKGGVKGDSTLLCKLRNYLLPLLILFILIAEILVAYLWDPDGAFSKYPLAPPLVILTTLLFSVTSWAWQRMRAGAGPKKGKDDDGANKADDENPCDDKSRVERPDASEYSGIMTNVAERLAVVASGAKVLLLTAEAIPSVKGYVPLTMSATGHVVSAVAVAAYIMIAFVFEFSTKPKPGEKRRTVMSLLLMVVMSGVLTYAFATHTTFTELLNMVTALLLIAAVGSLIYFAIWDNPIDALERWAQDPPGLVNGKRRHGSLIAKALLLIPCIFVLITSYVKKEFAAAPSSAKTLILVEIVFFTLWFGLPALARHLSSGNGVVVQKEPLYTDKETVLPMVAGLPPASSAHYTVSLWFFVDNQTPSVSEAYARSTPLFAYGGRPLVAVDVSKDALQVISNQVGHGPVVVAGYKGIRYQKWNNLVVTYQGGTTDVFLNGGIIGSKPSSVPMATPARAVVGHPDGIHGAVCDVRIFDTALSPFAIRANYSAGMGRTPPR